MKDVDDRIAVGFSRAVTRRRFLKQTMRVSLVGAGVVTGLRAAGDPTSGKVADHVEKTLE